MSCIVTGNPNHPSSPVGEAMAQGVCCEPRDFGTYLSDETGTAISCQITNKTAFFYSEFGCLVEDIRSSHGTERYQAFLKVVAHNHPFNVEKSFERIYGTNLDDEIARFKNGGGIRP